ncbi:MAG TPA: MDR family MFS transporter [Nocardioidaceae bacterium]|nr:MDR family MFS transporter [Nocardioidaceae bacterium]
MTSEAANDSRAPAGADGGFTHRQILTILSGLMLGMFLAALDMTVVSVAIRTIADELNGFELQVWATTAFLITSTISTPLYGKLSDIYGRRPFYLIAIAIFVAGSMLCGMAGSMYELAAFRAIQGVGAGGLMSLALAIIGDIVPPRERSRYQGIFMGVFGTSSVLGPLVGGFFAGTTTLFGISGWRWIFYVNVPIGILAFVVVAKVLHLPHKRLPHRIDWPGAVALLVALGPLLTIAEQGREWGWSSGRAVACYIIGAIGLLSFILIERWYKDEAILPLRLFKNRSFSISSASSLIVGIGMFGALIVLPLYLQVVKGSSPTEAGLQTTPLVLGILIGSMTSGVVISRTGRYKQWPVLGSALMIVGLLMFHYVGADTPLWQVMLIMPIFGIGLGLNMQPVIVAVQNAVSPREIGVATSSVTFFRQMGGTLGTAVFLSVLFSTVGQNIADALARAENSAAFQSAAAAHPQLMQTLQNSNALQDSSFINDLPDAIAHPFMVGFSESMDLVFVLGALVLLVGLLVIAFLPDLPLRDMSGIQARHADDAAAMAAEAAAEGALAPGGSAPSTATAPMSEARRSARPD